MFKHMGSRGGVKTRRDWDEIKGGVLSTRGENEPLLTFLRPRLRQQPNIIKTNLYIVDLSEREVSQTKEHVRFPQSKGGYRISLAADTKVLQSS